MVENAGNGIDGVSLLLEISSPRGRIACDVLHFRQALILMAFKEHSLSQ